MRVKNGKYCEQARYTAIELAFSVIEHTFTHFQDTCAHAVFEEGAFNLAWQIIFRFPYVTVTRHATTLAGHIIANYCCALRCYGRYKWYHRSLSTSPPIYCACLIRTAFFVGYRCCGDHRTVQPSRERNITSCPYQRLFHHTLLFYLLQS